jgi:hypothetical protein
MLSEFKPLIVVHGALAVLAMPFLPFSSIYSLPIIWALGSIPFAQIMVLAVCVGLPGQEALNWLPRAIAIVALFAAVEVTIDFRQGFRSGIGTDSWFGTVLFLGGYRVGFLLLLTLVMVFARRFLGEMQKAPDRPAPPGTERVQFSLFALMGVLSIVAVMLALLRGASEASAEQNIGLRMILTMALVFIVLSVNIFMTVWATLSPAPGVTRRVVAVFAIATILGVAIGATTLFRGDMDMEMQLLQLSAGMLLALTSTSILAFSLLYLRWHGFRLVPRKTPVEEEAARVAGGEDGLETG